MTVVELAAGRNDPITVGGSVLIRGHPNGSHIWVPDDKQYHAINVAPGAPDVTVEDVDVRHNRERGGVGTHAIRAEGNTRLTIRRCRLYDSPSYGIGFQGEQPFRYILVEQVEIDGCGKDGVDIKNDSGLNRDFTIRQTTVRNFALDGGDSAAFDIRGRVDLDQIRAENVPAHAYGARFRRDGPTGNGSANWSTLGAHIIRCVGGNLNRAVWIEPAATIDGVFYGRPKVAWNRDGGLRWVA